MSGSLSRRLAKTAGLRATAANLPPARLEDYGVLRPRLRRFRTVTVLSARTWRSGQNERATQALAARKTLGDPEFAGLITRECLAVLRDLLPGPGPHFDLVTTPPASRRPGAQAYHLATDVAERLGEALATPFRAVFAPWDRPRRHWAPEFVDLAPQVVEPVAGQAILLFDDVATSGRTLEKSFEALEGQGHRFILGLVWLSAR